MLTNKQVYNVYKTFERFSYNHNTNNHLNNFRLITGFSSDYDAIVCTYGMFLFPSKLNFGDYVYSRVLKTNTIIITHSLDDNCDAVVYYTHRSNAKYVPSDQQERNFNLTMVNKFRNHFNKLSMIYDNSKDLPDFEITNKSEVINFSNNDNNTFVNGSFYIDSYNRKFAINKNIADSILNINVKLIEFYEDIADGYYFCYNAINDCRFWWRYAYNGSK